MVAFPPGGNGRAVPFCLGFAKERDEEKNGGKYDDDFARDAQPINWDDDDVDDLLTWTKELDFDAYTKNWASLATSGPALNR